MNRIDRFLRATAAEQLAGAGRLAVFSFTSIFLLCGLAALYGTVVKPLAQSLGSKNWVQVEGYLDSGRPTGARQLRYVYEFEGEAYAGDRFSFSNTPDDFIDHQVKARLGERPEGASIRVLVDPGEPGNSVLQRRLRWGDAFGFFFALPFLAVGAVGWAFTFLGRSGYQRAVALRAEAAGIAEGYGAQGAAGELRAPDRWDDEDRSITFLDGTGIVRSAGLVFLNLFLNGMIIVFAMHTVLLFTVDDPGKWFLFLFMLPFEVVGIYCFVAMWRSLRAPRLPDIVIVANPIHPVADRMEVDVGWVHLGAQSEIEELEEFALEVVRGKHQLFRRKASAFEGLVVVSHAEHRAGRGRFVLEEIEQDSYLGGRLTPDYEGITELLVRIKRRGHERQTAAYMLGNSCQA